MPKFKYNLPLSTTDRERLRKAVVERTVGFGMTDEHFRLRSKNEKLTLEVQQIEEIVYHAAERAMDIVLMELGLEQR